MNFLGKKLNTLETIAVIAILVIAPLMAFIQIGLSWKASHPAKSAPAPHPSDMASAPRTWQLTDLREAAQPEVFVSVESSAGMPGELLITCGARQKPELKTKTNLTFRPGQVHVSLSFDDEPSQAKWLAEGHDLIADDSRHRVLQLEQHHTFTFAFLFPMNPLLKPSTRSRDSERS